MKEYTQVFFQVKNLQEQEILIAMLSEKGYDGFEQTDEMVKTFIEKVNFDENVLVEICKDKHIIYTKDNIPAQNWNQSWESNFQPVVVGDFVGIRADFHQPVTGVQHEIIITPKMSFGTGHHATTHLMIEQMQKIDFRHQTVIDFGTGTGILAILAEKLGASEIVGIDNDDWSIENAEENALKNDCCKIRLVLSDEPKLANQYGIILANINRNVIMENFSLLEKQLKEKGVLLISGLLEKDKTDIVDAANELDLKLEEEAVKNGWIALRFSRF